MILQETRFKSPVYIDAIGVFSVLFQFQKDNHTKNLRTLVGPVRLDSSPKTLRTSFLAVQFPVAQDHISFSVQVMEAASSRLGSGDADAGLNEDDAFLTSFV